MKPILLLCIVTGCGGEPAIGPDVGTRCADVGAGARACWTELGILRSTPRPGLRCEGAGEARACAPRPLFASPFECEADTCSARHVALPDAGQWECRDESGALLCLELAPAAGVASTDRVPGWRCGSRPSQQRVCIDTAPDRPAQGRFRCHVAHEHGERVRCDRDEQAILLGEACERGCPAGAVCAAGACVPRTSAIECWDASDCDGAECLLGACSR